MNNEKISPQHIQEALSAGKPILFLDVRDTEKYESGSLHIAGQETRNIPYIAMRDQDAHTLEQVDRLPQDTQIITVCTTGNKAGKAAALLRERGLDSVSLEGGLTAWEEFTSSKR